MAHAVKKPKWPIVYNEVGDPGYVVDGKKVIKSLAEMENQGLMWAALETPPWTDDYWPMFRGGLGSRYADPYYPSQSSWHDMKAYIENDPVTSVLERANPDELRVLSPSEKYGLWIGDASDQLTQASWAEGQWQIDNNSGKIENWMGICDGWAPAAFMEQRPIKKVTVPAADGQTQLEFYPSDIRALASLLWAKTRFESRYLGSRCNDRVVRRYRDGRAVDPACDDVNPGAWHIALVSQLGAQKKPMLIDSTFDFEIWNQPVYSYSYSYFNPATGRSVGTLDEAMVDIAQWRRDRFARYRSENTAFVVGISMELTYTNEADPVQVEDETGYEEVYETVRYVYDLELNAAGEIIGGEWYQNAHPDFVWVPQEKLELLTPGDRAVDGPAPLGSVLPAPWKDAAQSSIANMQPLAKLVRALIQKSRN